MLKKFQTPNRVASVSAKVETRVLSQYSMTSVTGNSLMQNGPAWIQKNSHATSVYGSIKLSIATIIPLLAVTILCIASLVNDSNHARDTSNSRDRVKWGEQIGFLLSALLNERANTCAYLLIPNS